jgi:hypothetical protein
MQAALTEDMVLWPVHCLLAHGKKALIHEPSYECRFKFRGPAQGAPPVTVTNGCHHVGEVMIRCKQRESTVQGLVFMYVCMYVCMYVRMFLYAYLFVYIYDVSSIDMDMT